ncbi:hypothetical protein [Clostridium sp. ZS2-4]|nr:hypothetical protein [Clostridium sp. ZS2-4]MCY6354208.1 hypothetical protein [Clostridium sp. ZS2-4]
MYDARLYKKSNKKIRTAVIYSSDISKAENKIDIGCRKYIYEEVQW